MEQVAEVERVRAIKPPLRYLPEEERMELLKVSVFNYLNLCLSFFIFFFFFADNNFFDRE